MEPNQTTYDIFKLVQQYLSVNEIFEETTIWNIIFKICALRFYANDLYSVNTKGVHLGTKTTTLLFANR